MFKIAILDDYQKISQEFFDLKKYSKKFDIEIFSEPFSDENELIENLKPNKQRMLALSDEGYTTSTDFADYLVQNNNMSFREAYKISAKLINYAEKKKKKLSELKFSEIKKVKSDLDKSVMKVFDVKNSVNLKSSHGGTAIKNIKKMILKLKKEFK